MNSATKNTYVTMLLRKQVTRLNCRIVFFLAYIYCFLVTGLHAQHSFVKEIDMTSVSDLGNATPILGIKTFETGGISMAVLGYESVSLLTLDADGTFSGGYNLIPDNLYGLLGAYYTSNGIGHAMTLRGTLFNAQNALIYVNVRDNIYWSKQLTNTVLRVERVCFDLSGNLLVTQQMEPAGSTPDRYAGVSYMNAISGASEWNHYYAVSNFHTGQRIQTVGLTAIPSGGFSMINHIFVDDLSYSTILKINQVGNVIQSIGVNGEELVFFGHVYDDNGYCYGYGSIPSADNPLVKDGFITKMDTTLRVLWTKRIHAPNFDYYRMDVNVNDAGFIYFSYATFGDFPVIAGRMDTDGNMDWYKGYAVYDPRLSVSSQNEMVMISSKKYLPDGSFTDYPMVFKTNTDGELGTGCETFEACLMVEDVTVETYDLEWTQLMANAPLDLGIEVSPIEVPVNDYCWNPEFPTPYFEVPEKTCEKVISPTRLNNELANANRWMISGQNVDTVLNTRNFTFTFREAGVYDISQIIWVLGCPYRHDRRIEILDADAVELFPSDTTTCANVLTLIPQYDFSSSARFHWDSGEENQVLDVTSGGVYTLRVEDLGCVFIDSVVVHFQDQALLLASISIPRDTIICVSKLPFTLKPFSPLTNQFLLEGQEIQDSIFYLTEPNDYHLVAHINGCQVSKEFILQTIDCESIVYLPTAFSPNSDGINDSYTALGNHFSITSLAVFDRWGGHIYQNQEFPFSWNGKSSSGEPAPAGVYVVVFNIFNELSQSVEVHSSEVLLIR